MTLTTLPTSRPVTQDWNQDFQWLNGKFYPNGFYASVGWKGHNGIDYGCWEGDPVEAVCDGVIEFAGDGNNHWLLSGGGNAILLRNDTLGIRFEYLHLSRFEVQQGQRVARGQIIARSGNTGISSAPHLHIGAIPVNDVNTNNGYRGRIDPTPYLYGPMNPDYAGSAAIAPQGTITPVQEDDMSDEQYKALSDKIDVAIHHAYRAAQVANAIEDSGTRAKVNAIDERTALLVKDISYVKGSEDPSLYERFPDNTLRGITLAEWQVTGKPYVVYPQADFNKIFRKVA